MGDCKFGDKMAMTDAEIKNIVTSVNIGNRAETLIPQASGGQGFPNPTSVCY
jgi:hypothetical protein